MKNPLHSVPAGRYLAIAALAIGAVPFAAATASADPVVYSVSATTTVTGWVEQGNVEGSPSSFAATSVASADPVVYSVSATMVVSGTVEEGNADGNPGR